MKIVKVEWVDAQSPANPGWVFLEDIDTSPQKIITVGLVVKEKKNSITIASQFDKDKKETGALSGVIIIPKRNIKTMKVLK